MIKKKKNVYDFFLKKNYDAIFISIICLIILVHISRFNGIHIDEGIYLSKSLGFGKWLLKILTSSNYEEFSDLASIKTMTEYFDDLGGNNMFKPGGLDPHPPLTKIITFFGYILSPDFLTGLQKLRLGNCLLITVMIYFLYRFAVVNLGRLTAFISIFIFMTFPQVLGYAPTGLTDPTAMSINFLCIICFFEFHNTNKFYYWLTPFLFGLMFLAKISVLITLFTVLIIIIFQSRKIYFILKFAVSVIFGYVIFICLTPQFWNDPVLKPYNYFLQHIKHYHTEILVFNHLVPSQYSKYIFWYPFFIFLFTLPSAYLFLFIYWIKNIITRSFKFDKIKLFIAINSFIPLLISCLPFPPKYGSTRLFLSVFPFAALLFGIITVKFISKFSFRIKIFLLTLLFIVQPVLLYIIHPHYLLYSNEISKTIYENEKLGIKMQECFMELNETVISYLNSLPENTKIIFEPYNYDFLNLMYDNKILNKGIIAVKNIKEADYVVMLASFHVNLLDYAWKKIPAFKTFSSNNIDYVKIFKISDYKFYNLEKPYDFPGKNPGKLFWILNWLINIIFY
ncbi:glycosyltransferase family 39 protein, partial [Candidatus Dependentiae bacterium]|nr:glycosyltransferase family 39 protein [Candidatus Dependentiae bacterium]